MATIFIIHGSYGHPGENWFPWLKKELEKIGHQVFVPKFPIPATRDEAYSGHDLKAWLATMDEYKKYIHKRTIFVGHSRGCIFLYKFLEYLVQPVQVVFLVAPWINYHWYPKGWKTIDSFHETPFQWEKIKHGSKYFEVYQSTNDYTSIAEGREIADTLGATFITVENAGHFNIASDPKYKTFELLLENIKKIL